MAKIYILMSLIFASCAGLQEQAVKTYCNPEGGYQKGINDAREQKPMNNGFVQMCSDDVKGSVQTAYREGYTKGLELNKESTPQSVINVNFGSGSGTTSSRAYFCEGHAFTQTFKSFGPTELEARENVKTQCQAQYHEMHCGNINCRRN